MSNVSEKRSSFRIIESLKLKYEVVSELDFADAMKRNNAAGAVGATSLRARLLDLDARLDEALFTLGRHAPGVKEALELMNNKLRLLAQVVPELAYNADSLADAPAQECELSADSLVFETNDELATDTKLKLRFFLISENRYFETLAYVYRVDPQDSGRNRVVTCFEGMPSAERDALFQHLFSMQSETLRMRRIAAEDGMQG